MTNLLKGLKNETNYRRTENGAVTYKSTNSSLYDFYAMGGAMRKRPDKDIIDLFNDAFIESPEYALKCLFYLRDILEGQGERRLFRVCINSLAKSHPNVVKKVMPLIPQYGRWDDLYSLINTPVEKDMWDFLYNQFLLDLVSETPSLLGKWLKSENASSSETKRIGRLTRINFDLTPKVYRKSLSLLRNKLRIVERLMSENRWDEIKFDKIPSKAGLKYRNAFARNDITRERYAAFAKNKNTKVNAKALYPYEVVHQALGNSGWWRGLPELSDTDRIMINKYWDNLTDYFNKSNFNALAVVDTSGSMIGTPMNVAISLGMYCADKARGPFHNHYISFSRLPKLVEIKGFDFVDKVRRIYDTNLCEDTNIEATFDLILSTMINNHLTQKDLPQNLIVISDMEFDNARYGSNSHMSLMELIRRKWKRAGFDMPHLIFWNVDARHNNIPMRDEDGITFVSGFSPVIFESIMTGKSGQDMMYDKLNSKRYEEITI